MDWQQSGLALLCLLAFGCWVIAVGSLVQLFLDWAAYKTGQRQRGDLQNESIFGIFSVLVAAGLAVTLQRLGNDHSAWWSGLATLVFVVGGIVWLFSSSRLTLDEALQALDEDPLREVSSGSLPHGHQTGFANKRFCLAYIVVAVGKSKVETVAFSVQRCRGNFDITFDRDELVTWFRNDKPLSVNVDLETYTKAHKILEAAREACRRRNGGDTL